MNLRDTRRRATQIVNYLIEAANDGPNGSVVPRPKVKIGPSEKATAVSMILDLVEEAGKTGA